MSDPVVIPYHNITVVNNITVADLGVFTSAGGNATNSSAVQYCQTVDVEAGTYFVEVATTNAWGDTFKESNTFDVPSGKLVIGEAIYFFGDADISAWVSFLSTTNTLRDVGNGMVVLMGDRGSFPTQITIVKQ